MAGYSYDRRKTAAVDKVPIFPKFEVKVPAAKIEKMVAKHYDIVPGSCKLRKGIEKSHNGAYINFDCQGTDGKNYGGSVIVYLENHGNSVRAVAFVNVDG